MSMIPKARRKVVHDLSKIKILLYGPPKIGKSTLASCFPGAWFLATEQGFDFIECYEPTVIDSWATFEKLLSRLTRKPPTTFGDGQPINTLVIDTVDILFKHCCDAVVQRVGADTMFDIEHGKGWHQSGNVFQKALTALSHLPYGIILISHAGDRIIRSSAGSTNRIEPNMVKTGRSITTGWADMILYASIENVKVKDGKGQEKMRAQRVLRTRPKSNLTAGDRSGRLPAQVPMSYTELVKYFPDTPQEIADRGVGKETDEGEATPTE